MRSPSVFLPLAVARNDSSKREPGGCFDQRAVKDRARKPIPDESDANGAGRSFSRGNRQYRSVDGWNVRQLCQNSWLTVSGMSPPDGPAPLNAYDSPSATRAFSLLLTRRPYLLAAARLPQPVLP